MRWPPVIFAELFISGRYTAQTEGFYLGVKPIFFGNLANRNETVGRDFASRDTWYD